MRKKVKENPVSKSKEKERGDVMENEEKEDEESEKRN